MKKLHIHRFKRVAMHFEQPVMSVDGRHIIFHGNKAYWDLEIKKCRCGKEKKSLHNFYTADREYMPITKNLFSLQLVNKQSII